MLVVNIHGPFFVSLVLPSSNALGDAPPLLGRPRQGPGDLPGSSACSVYFCMYAPHRVAIGCSG